MLEELTLRKAIEFAVKTEELGQLFYQKLARKFEDNEELKNTFELLSRDEAIHEKQFRALMEKVPEDERISGKDERLQFLRAMSMSEFFMGQEGLFKKLEKIKEADDALLEAFELEKATLQYYDAMKEFLGDSDALNAVIAAEKSHVLKLMNYLVTGARFRGIAGGE